MPRLALAVVIALILYLMAMINARHLIPRDDDLIDCMVGDYTFTLMRKDCHERR